MEAVVSGRRTRYSAIPHITEINGLQNVKSLKEWDSGPLTAMYTISVQFLKISGSTKVLIF